VERLSKSREGNVLRLDHPGTGTGLWDGNQFTNATRPLVETTNAIFCPYNAIPNDRQLLNVPDRAVQEQAVTRVFHFLTEPEFKARLG
jgi:hypothetical protein